MSRLPLTLEEAKLLCSQHQYLAGEIFNNDYTHSLKVEAVVVAPYDEVSKTIYMDEYHKYKNTVEALDSYNGTRYDVMVIARSLLNKECVFDRDLDTYLEERKTALL